MQSVRQGARSCARRLCIGGLAVLAVAVSACGASSSPASRTTAAATSSSPAQRPGVGKPPFTLGTKNFTEEFILGQLYAQALRAKGYRVTLKNDLGPSELMDRKLTSGAIDGYPEYTGTILTVFGHKAKRPSNAAEAYRLAAGVERSRDATLLGVAPATDTDVLIAKPAYAAQHRRRSLSDVARLGPTASLAGPPEFRTRLNGLVGLKHDYGISSIHFLPIPIGQQYVALANGRTDLAVAFTTDGNLTRGGFALLADPKGTFGFQNVTFVVRNGVLGREGPDFAKTIDSVSARLTTQALRLMNAAVSLDQQDPTAVARQFLGANGLL